MNLEAISLLGFLPAGTANIGEGVSRDDLHQMGYGQWSARGNRIDDLRAVLPPPADTGAEGSEPAALGVAPSVGVRTFGLGDYDEVIPAEEYAPRQADAPVELRFTGT